MSRAERVCWERLCDHRHSVCQSCQGVRWWWRPKTSDLPHWPELGGEAGKVPRGGLGLSLRTAPEHELLWLIAKVQPSLFICDHNQSHDIYVHTPGLFRIKQLKAYIIFALYFGSDAKQASSQNWRDRPARRQTSQTKLYFQPSLRQLSLNVQHFFEVFNLLLLLLS